MEEQKQPEKLPVTMHVETVEVRQGDQTIRLGCFNEIPGGNRCVTIHQVGTGNVAKMPLDMVHKVITALTVFSVEANNHER